MKTNFPHRLPLTNENHKGLKVLAANNGEQMQETGNDLIEKALINHRKALKSGAKMPKGK